jgi:hypothetical protein
MDEEIKAKKRMIRARIREGLSWKLPVVLAGTYAVLFGATQLVFRVAGLVVKIDGPFQPFSARLATELAFGVANIAVGFSIAGLVLLYVLCPVTGPFALKLREPKLG